MKDGALRDAFQATRDLQETVAIVAVVALVAVLGAGWATDFRYPVRRLAGPASAWKTTANAWLRHCDRHPAGTITVSFKDWWGGKTPLTNTFSCTSLHR